MSKARGRDCIQAAGYGEAPQAIKHTSFQQQLDGRISRQRQLVKVAHSDVGKSNIQLIIPLDTAGRGTGLRYKQMGERP